MVISDEKVEKYQALYKARFGTEISKQDAYEQAMKLVTLLKIIYKPMSKADYKMIEERNQYLHKKYGMGK